MQNTIFYQYTDASISITLNLNLNILLLLYILSDFTLHQVKAFVYFTTCSYNTVL